MRRLLEFVFTAILPFAALTSASTQQTASAPPQSPSHDIGTHLRSKGIPNFGQVSPTLYRGGQPTAEGLEEVHHLGVEVVVDLRGGGNESEGTIATKLGMQYISIPSHCPFPRDEPFAKFLKVIQDNPGKKVFVHCRLGDDRTGMAVASYRMADQGWSASEAMKEMREFGFSAAHHAICPGLASYEQEFPEHFKKDSAFKDLREQKK